MNIRKYLERGGLSGSEIEIALDNIQNISGKISFRSSCGTCVLPRTHCDRVAIIDVKYLHIMSDYMQKIPEVFGRWSSRNQ